MESPSKILLRGPNFLGDHILAFPFYEGLRRRYPHAEITWLGPAALSSLMPDGLEFLVKPFTKDWRPLAQELRQAGYDLAVGLPASLSSALLFWASRIPARVAFAESAAAPFLTHALSWVGRSAGKHKALIYLELLHELGGEGQPFVPHVPAKERERIVVAPGASLPLREWPYFIELIQWLRKEYPEKILTVVGAQTESVWHRRLERLADPFIHNLVGRTSLTELRQIMREADFVVSNDSGPAHLAATLAGVPTYVLMGPGDPGYILPRGGLAVAVRRADLRCSPCESAVCRALVKKDCLNGLELESVIDAIAKHGKNSKLPLERTL